MFNYILENGTDIVAGIVALMAFLKIVVNLTPTVEDNKLFGKLDNLFDSIIPNYTKQNKDANKSK
tara:strand:- start:399 stop:593 length:195 start_codon:yes stop_codon:yes gene_type:complete